MRAAFWRFASIRLIQLLRKALWSHHRASGRLPDFLYDFEPVAIEPARLRDVRVFADRLLLLDSLPKGGVAVEVGTQTGAFAREILDRIKPDRLHVIDVSYRLF